MISVEEAYKMVLSHIPEQHTERIPFQQSVGRVLALPVMAERDLPPFNRVAMDGIAFRYADFERGKRRFEIVGTIAAGDPISTVDTPGTAVEIMTGAALPEGLDTVVRYEDLNIEGGYAMVGVEALKKGQNVHHRGTDNAQGDLLIPAGHRIRPTDISMLASEGLEYVEVRKPPSIAIISSGDELVEVGGSPLPHQIRRSNVYAIRALLSGYHPEMRLFHLRDDPGDIRDGLTEALEAYDALILVGGVSKGKFDFIPDILMEKGAVKRFHGVAQRPGKPFWFGHLGKKVIFALPGNPVSSMAGTTRYVLPWLRRSLGLDPDFSISAVLAEDIEFRPALTRLVEASVTIDVEGRCWATPQLGHGSGDFTRLVYSRGFLELPAGARFFRKGELFRFWHTGALSPEEQFSG